MGWESKTNIGSFLNWFTQSWMWMNRQRDIFNVHSAINCQTQFSNQITGTWADNFATK
ncbi:hypothetical protein HMPREF9103_00343 [Lentilactobacillus parafarraginis F0439]|uniref:Uncharacterized protein n=1 Tax=Lentilactobacillus parafarraginis F0439 TaxID=797515 RepID=G9ZKU5_9LACO|nr:hypothetical protein HMPREF9103_00343 [Lentilactobacillus parafarraginis F0439]